MLQRVQGASKERIRGFPVGARGRSCGLGNGPAGVTGRTPLLAYALGRGHARRYRHHDREAFRGFPAYSMLGSVFLFEHGCSPLLELLAHRDCRRSQLAGFLAGKVICGRG
jgi:hypothetical protein